MKPLLDVLVILDALERGSFAAASAKLFKTPSALSYTIHRLESDLNIQLLDRSGHRALYPHRTDAAGERAGSAAYRPRTGDPGG
jgi:DNA-binding transcriptional LysR family regulator